VAISMPGVETNTSKIEGLSPKHTAKEKAGDASFLDVLMDADAGQSDVPKVEKSLSPKTTAKLTRQGLPKASNNPAKATASVVAVHSASPNRSANNAAAKVGSADSVPILTKDVPVVVSTPITLPPPTTMPVADSGHGLQQVGTTPLDVPTMVTSTAEFSRASITENPTPVPSVHSSTTTSTGSRVTREPNGVRAAEQMAAVLTKATNFALPLARIAIATYLGKTTSATTLATVSESADAADDSAKASPAKQTDDADQQSSGAVQFLAPGNPSQDGIENADLARTVSLTPVVTPQPFVTKVQSALQEHGPIKIAKADSGVSSGHPVQAEPTRAAQVHAEYKQVAAVSAEPHVSQHAVAPKEEAHADANAATPKAEAKADEHAPVKVGPTAVTAVKGTQQPSSNNLGQREKQKGEPPVQAVSTKATPETRPMADSKFVRGSSAVSPSAEARNNFSELMTSQVPVAAKQDGSSAHVPGTSVQPQAGVAAQLRDAQDIAPEHPTLVAAAPRGVHSARLVNQSGQSELRVGFKAGEFGNVDIRTSMVRGQVTAQISVEHGELRNLLVVELPHLQEKLAGNPLTPANVMLSNYTGGSSSGSRNAYKQNAQQSQSSNARENDTQPVAQSTFSEAHIPSTQLDVHM